MKITSIESSDNYRRVGTFSCTEKGEELGHLDYEIANQMLHISNLVNSVRPSASFGGQARSGIGTALLAKAIKYAETEHLGIAFETTPESKGYYAKILPRLFHEPRNKFFKEMVNTENINLNHHFIYMNRKKKY